MTDLPGDMDSFEWIARRCREGDSCPGYAFLITDPEDLRALWVALGWRLKEIKETERAFLYNRQVEAERDNREFNRKAEASRLKADGMTLVYAEATE